MAELIQRKRDGLPLTPEEIQFWIKGVTSQEIPDYQTTAMLMAIYFKGMDIPERSALTRAMAQSGSMLHANEGDIRIDKHSTGGVGDKTSLILAPLLSLFGAKVPMISGRGLGFTGGTLDKLDAIPGFNARLGSQEIDSILEECGCMIIGQTASLAPADKKIYSLRDVTSTVNEISLITASILSKKLSENLTHLVMDVKCGSGAFMKDQKMAQQLAESIASTSEQAGVRTSCLITRMDFPLGVFTGNFCEDFEILEYIRPDSLYFQDFMNLKVDKSLEELSFTTTSDHPRANLVLVTTALALQMAHIITRRNYIQLKNEIAEFWKSGALMERFFTMVKLQGGNVHMLKEKADEFETLLANHEKWYEFKAPQNGFLSACDGEALGHLMVTLGAGRKKAEDDIDHSVSLQVLKAEGSQVKEGDIILRMYCGENKVPDKTMLDTALNTIFMITPDEKAREPYICQIMNAW